MFPPDVATLDLADEAIDLWQFYSRKTLDPEQVLAVQLMMAQNSAHRWAARTTGRCEARQNGKGDEVEVVELYGATILGEAIIHSAHEIPTSRAAHLRLATLLESHRDLRAKTGKVLFGDGKQEINFKNGAIIVYRTRTKGGGRGLDDVSRIVIDEAQHLKGEHLGSLTSTTAVSPNSQFNFTGSAGIADESEEWWDIRERAIRALLEGADPGEFSYLEHGAEILSIDQDGMIESTSPDARDVAAWRRANPGMRSGRITEAWLWEELRLLKDEKHLREHLCIWDPRKRITQIKPKIDPHWWRNIKGNEPFASQVIVGVDTTHDLDLSAVVLAGRQAGGTKQLQVVQQDAGTHWVELALLDIFANNDVHSVVIDATGPARSIRRMLERVCGEARNKRGEPIKLEPLPQNAYEGACRAFVSDVQNAKVFQPDDPRLSNIAVATPARKLAEGWVWDRRVGGAPILVAATVANFAADALVVERRRSAYEDDDLLVV